MRPCHIAFCVGTLVAITACAPAQPGAFRTAYIASTPAVEHSARLMTGAARDSALAQEFADRQGPRVRVHTYFTNLGVTRRVAASFRLDDDAYVVVGHMDADGVVRIVFPTDPKDDGFVRGGTNYSVPEFSAGFTNAYQFRPAFDLFAYRRTAVNYDSYDGGTGFVFVIATWRPMRFDRFTDAGRWDSFEVADRDYLHDPRPAVYELAALLSGENREAYSVEFSRYITSTNYSAAGYGSSAFSSLCYARGGFATSPMDFRFGTPYYSSQATGYYQTYYRRGTRYAYDDMTGCSYPLPYSSGIQYAGIPAPFVPNQVRPPARIADQPTTGPGGTPMRPRDAEFRGKPGSPADPAATEYRRRGLVAAPEETNARRRPNNDGGAPIARPRIQDMVAGADGREPRYTRPSARGRDNTGGNEGRSNAPQRRATGNDYNSSEPRSYQPRARTESDGGAGRQTAQPRTETRSEPRSLPPSASPRAQPTTERVRPVNP